MPNLTLTPRQICDLGLIQNGGFAPLASFMGKAEYESVVSDMRLPGGVVWPMPIVLDITEELASKLSQESELVLEDAEGIPLAKLVVREMWKPNREHEAEGVFGTTNTEHPGVRALLTQTKDVYVTGPMQFLHAPVHYDFNELRQTPTELKAEFKKLGWTKVVAFQTRNPLHRGHFELMRTAAKRTGANLLLHPVVGLTKPGDIDYVARVRGYARLMEHFPEGTARLSLLNLAMRMGGPREALWHAVIRKNHGCTHFIVGRDHAGPGSDSSGKPFYGPYDAQDMVKKYADEVGIEPVFSREMVYVKTLNSYLPEDEVPAGHEPERLSATQLRNSLEQGTDLPEWFSFPEIIEELRKSNWPRSKQGFTVFFTGLPSAGKSTIAQALLVKLNERGGRRVTLLDGDLVRKNLSSELGFSREHRDLNIRRIGYVAAEITKHGGSAICAPIAPFEQTRCDVREMISPYGAFVLVHVATPVEECERRDRKGLYAKARKGEVANFTGVSDPYEVPADAEISIDTLALAPGEAADVIIRYLEDAGYLEKTVPQSEGRKRAANE